MERKIEDVLAKPDNVFARQVKEALLRTPMAMRQAPDGEPLSRIVGLISQAQGRLAAVKEVS